MFKWKTWNVKIFLEDLDGLFLANFFFDNWEEGEEEDTRSWVSMLSDSWMFLITLVLSSIDSKEVEDIF